jgi:hypothetical protein
MSSYARLLLALILFANFQPLAGGPAQSVPRPSVQTTPQSPQAVAYYDGTIQYSSVLNCVSIIQGAPYYEYGIGTYVGFAADPINSLPGPGQVYYLHLVMAGLGNACSGQRAYPNIQLPSSTNLAISGANPVICYSNGTRFNTSECPQSLPASNLNPGAYDIPSIDSAHAYTWPIPQGWTLEFQIPVTTSVAITGALMQANVWTLDGNSNPQLHPQQGVYVFSNTPSVFYPSPSVDGITTTSATFHSTLFAHGQGGTIYFDVGTTTGYSLATVSGTIQPGYNALQSSYTWPASTFAPGTTYHWRARFVSTAGPTYTGGDQTFSTLPDGLATVGSGAAADCTAAAFNAALLTPGVKNIAFNCGSAPVSIAMSGPVTVTGSLNIDGGNKVTLQGNNTFRLFDVAAPAILTLNNITLMNGATAGCGGAIHVQGSASLMGNSVRLLSNQAATGGGLCLDANGSAELNCVFIRNNQASSDGGGIYNAGLVDLMWSEVSSNAAGGTGSGGGVYNSGAIYFVTSLLAENSTVNGGTAQAGGLRAGGGLYNVGTTANASFFNTTVANNIASYGGGVYNNGGTVSATTATIAGNVSNVIAKNAEFQSGGLQSDINGNAFLKNTILANNTAAGLPANCGQSPQKTIISQGNNLDSGNQCGLNAAGDLINTDPKLMGLGNFGGLTRTMALMANSPAIDVGDNAYCGMYDQRGFSGPTPQGSALQRQVDGTGKGTAVCDLGAFEYHPTVYLPIVRR